MRLASLFLACWSLAAAALASPDAPVALTRPDDALGAPHSPGLRPLSFAGAPYVEEEFFVEGNASVYTYEETPRPTVVLEQQADVPYKTRLIVRRPADPTAFRGTVVLEWFNSTAGFDGAIVWDASADHFGRRGWIYVGITNADTGFGGPGTGPISFLRNGCRLFGLPVAECGTRYATLSLPESGQAYEIVSQVVARLKSADPAPLVPAGYGPVERVFHTGQSQQGASLITYATAFHDARNDGYFVQTASLARPINAGPACGSAGAPAYPGCTPRLAGRDRLVRTDLDVPVYRLVTETDLGSSFGVLANDARQEDAAHFRYYEVAGAAHSHVHRNVDVIPGFLTLEQTCANPLNTHADGPVYASYVMNALWQAMEREAIHGTPAPPGRLVAVRNGAIERDAFGNAVGGVRLPELEVPVATYTGTNVVNTQTVPRVLQPLLGLFCALAGSAFPFDEAMLDALYPTHGAYVSRYTRAVNRLVQQKLLLPVDAQKLRSRAFLEGP